MRVALLLVGLAACSKPGPELPPSLASCDYLFTTTQKNHSCTDVFDADAVAPWESFCKSLEGRRSHGQFTRGEPCPRKGSKGGCVQRDGSITWNYLGEVSCLDGQPFSDDPPARVPAAPYRCARTGACSELRSVFDLVPTAETHNCKSLGGTFSAGSCPTQDLVGRCLIGEGLTRSTMFLYSPATAADAKRSCEAAGATFAR